MAYARLVTSPMPHARVKNVDLDEALAMEGVFGVLSAEDVYPVEAPQSAILTNEPVFIGDPILAIAAASEQIAEDAMAKIKLELEPLPFSVTPTDSLRPGGSAARTEGNVFAKEMRQLTWDDTDIQRLANGQRPTSETPIQWQYGDLEAGFDNAEVVLEESFVTTGYAHMSMEARSTLSYWQNGRCYVHASGQSQSFMMPFLARMIGIELDKLTYIGEHCGGGFGSKLFPYPTMALPAYFSRKIGRPVMLRVTREEEYYIGSARVGFQGWMKAGFAKDGRCTAVDLYIVQDIGCKATSGDGVAAGGAVSILYQPDALRLSSVPVLTNTTPRGPQRGPGQNQIAAVFEPMLDKAARELGVDRLAIRRINAPDSSAKMNADQHPVTSAYMRPAFDEGGRLWRWSEKSKRSGKRRGSKVTGVGVGQAYHSAGASGYDGLVRITPDGKIHLHSGVGNLGTYSYASTTRAAAEVLKCDWSDCVIHHGNSDLHLPWSSYQAGSNTSFTHTRANFVAATDAVDKLKRIAAETLGGGVDDYDIDGRRVFHKDNSRRGISYADAAARAIELGGIYSGAEAPEDINALTKIAVAGLTGSGLIGVAKDTLPIRGEVPGFALAFAEIELDLETGKFDIVDYMAFGECGTVLHPQGLAGQLRGGAVWGFGMASLERHVYDPQNGLPANVSYYQCKPPSCLDVPAEMEWAALDEADPDNPVGVRGIGEPAMGCATAAVMCALSDALGGHLFNRTPVTADLILDHLAGRPTPAIAINTF